MVNLLVCVRYGADPAKETGKFCTNPFDLFAMETAARIKDAAGARVFALTHGNTAAESVLRDCAAIGAEQIWRVDGGGDSAEVLTAAVKEIERQEGVFSAIFCGSQSIDGGSRYVGPALAEFLQRSFVPDVIAAAAEDTSLRVTQEGAQQNFDWCVPYPCVITVTKPLFAVRQPTIRDRLAANRAEVRFLQAVGMGQENTELDGVVYADLPTKGTCVFLTGSPSVVSGRLLQELAQCGVL